MRRGLALAATGLVFLAACSDNNRPAPTESGPQFDKGVPCPTTPFPLSQANSQITGVYPAGPLRKDALAKAADIAKRWSQCKVADPQGKVVAFVTKLLSSDTQLDLKRWVRGVDLTADRVGFLLSHDLETATQIIKASDENTSSVSTVPTASSLAIASSLSTHSSRDGSGGPPRPAPWCSESLP